MAPARPPNSQPSRCLQRRYKTLRDFTGSLGVSCGVHSKMSRRICVARTSWSRHVPLPAKLAPDLIIIDNQVPACRLKKNVFSPSICQCCFDFISIVALSANTNSLVPTGSTGCPVSAKYHVPMYLGKQGGRQAAPIRLKYIIRSPGACPGHVIFPPVKAPRGWPDSLCSAGLRPSSATVFSSHIAPAPASASTHRPGNSIFFSYHSSSSLPNAVFKCTVLVRKKKLGVQWYDRTATMDGCRRSLSLCRDKQCKAAKSGWR